MDFSNIKVRLTLGTMAAGIYALLTNPQVVALLPAPWNLIVTTFVSGAVAGGVLYNMDPKKQEPK